MANFLFNEASAYLKRQSNHPINWYPWGSEAFETAKSRQVPIYLSIGFASCHWCHVMEEESFQDPTIAALINDHFVAIKVDREELPDIDALYQSSLSMFGQTGGWPLNMFLDQDGIPFWGGTYYPKTPRYNRPALPDVLQSISNSFQNEPSRIQKNTSKIARSLRNLSKSKPGKDIPMSFINQAAGRLLKEIDPLHGGILGSPKFPHFPVLELLWRSYKRTKMAPFKEAVTLTLTQICQGGIYDHVGGGFHRYAIDEIWLIPHFEKMLYDNAQYIELLTSVWQDTKDKLYEMRIAETINWVSEHMVFDGGALASSLDADSQGEEGLHYAWSTEEIDNALGSDASEFMLAYGITSRGNFNGKTIINRLRHMHLHHSDKEKHLRSLLDKLKKYRHKRKSPPARDNKALADSSAMMITALVKASQAFHRPDWLTLAKTCYDFLCQSYISGTVQERMEGANRLHHTYCNGQARHHPVLDDYAHVIRASFALYDCTNDRIYLDKAKEYLVELNKEHLDQQTGCYYLTNIKAENRVTRLKQCVDYAIPSGNAIMIENLTRFSLTTGDPKYLEQAQKIMAHFAGTIHDNFFPIAGLFNAVDFMKNAIQVVIVGDADSRDTQDLLRINNSVSLPNRLSIFLPTGKTLPMHHPAFGKNMINGEATAYICAGEKCSDPISHPDEFKEIMDNL